ncbi:MAG TPA: capsule assembly Wzi family protein, partial [Gemmatimonadaceae bacterium]|nr:capsule assembly Wzi family protein [Gemmatimonadaceae bacterium]
ADIDRLIELGMLDTVIVGQRPYSRREMVRLYSNLMRTVPIGAGESNVAAALAVSRLQSHLGLDSGPDAEDGWAPIDAASLTLSSTDARRRGFSGSITRQLEATIDPLAARRLGTPAPRGQSLALELEHVVEPTSWLALHARERVEGVNATDASGSSGRAELLLGGARMRYRNTALQIGREEIAWAQRAGDGLLLASDAPALDLVSIASDAPFALPGPFRRMGPAQATLLLADLGPSVARSHSKLLAYKVSLAPRPGLEVGAFFLNHFGGQGGRASSLGNRLIDFLPFVDIFRGHNYTDTTRTLDVDSDKQLGIDGRMRFDALGGLTVATELLIDDFDVHRIRTLFTWDGAQSLRIVLPRFGRTALAGELSAKHTGIRTYTHGSLSNGITTRGRLLGDELGPDAKSFGALLRWRPAGPTEVSVEGRSAIYSRADYVTIEQGSYFVIRRTADAANEQRDGLTLVVTRELGRAMRLSTRAAGLRIRNADFAGSSRRDYAASVGLQFAR